MSQVVAVGKEDQPFVGRENEQKEYWDFLAGKSDAPWLLVISGLGGIGKSTLLNILYKQTLEQNALPDTFAILLNFDTGTDTEPSLRTDPLLFLNELAHLLKPHCDTEQFAAFTETLQRGRSQLAQLKEQVEQTSQSFAREYGMQPPSDARQTIRFAELEVNRQVRESVTEAFYRQVDTFQPERLVIMLDTCELLNESGSWIFSQWLMNEFLPELHSRMWRKSCFFVMAGRIPPESEVIDEYDQQHIVLSMLEESAVDTYLEKKGLHDSALRQSVYKITCGHALCVAIIGQFYQNRGQEALQAIDTSEIQTEFDQNASVEFINERILNKLDNPFKDLTQFGVLLRTFTLPLLRAVFPDLFRESDAKAVFDQFIRYPYIESRGNYRYAFHELIREVLAKNTQKQDLARWRQYHKKALDYFSAGEASSRSMDWYYHNLAYEEVKGMSDWRKAVQEARDRGDTQRVSLLLHITDDVALNLTVLTHAECAYEWGRLSVDRRQPLDKALEKYEESFRLYGQVGDHPEEARLGQANVLQAMGDVQQSKVQLDKALHSYQDALDLLQRSEKRSLEVEAQVLKKIGDVQQLRGNLGDLDSALENYKQALNLFRQVANNLQAAQVLKDMGDVELQRHKLRGDLDGLNAAIENYEQALSLFRQTKHRSKEDEAKILEAVGDVYELRYQLSADRRDLEVSKESYQQAFALFSDDTNARKRVKEKVEGREQRDESAEEANVRRAMEEMQRHLDEQKARYPTAPPVPPPMVGRVGPQFANYRLIRLLGKGSFGEVYLGEHIHEHTLAAVKLLQVRLTPKDLGEFIKEASAAFRLHHPNIVRLLDFGISKDDTPFLAMAYAPNGTLRHRHPNGTRVPLPTIVSYVKQVASALQYSHDKRLIHRDVKPENMLVGAHHEILLSDFGIALVAQSSRSHQPNVQEAAGTLAYMAPEQLQGKPRPATDQYALGIIVYEWLSGDRPFHGTFTEVASQHMFVPPAPLHEKVPTIPPAVEQVVMTALAKDPKQRFDSVQAFATALEQASQPSLVTPSHLPRRVPPSNQASRPTGLVIPPGQSAPPSELITRPELPVQSTGMDTPSNQTSRPPDLWTPAGQAFQIPSAYPSANLAGGSRAPRRVSRRAVVLGLGLAGLAIAGGGLFLLAPSHGLHISGQTPTPAASPPNPTPPPIPLGSVLYTYRGHSAVVDTVAWSPDGRRIASGSFDKTVQVWDAADGGHAFTYRGHSAVVDTVAWSPNGGRIASGSYDQTVQVWDAADGGHVLTYRGHSDTVAAVAWSPDGRRIASGSGDKTVQVWDAADVYTYRGHSDVVFAVAWSSDGRRIASGSGDGTVQVWDASSGQTLLTYKGHTDIVNSVAWSPDGRHLASASADHTVQVWDASSGQTLLTYKGHTAVVSVAWSPDGRRIASGSDDHTVQVWDVANGGNVFTYRGHSDNVEAVVWSPDGRRIASGSNDHTVQVLGAG